MDNFLSEIIDDKYGYVVMNRSLLWNLGLHSSILIGELSSKYEYWKTNDRLTPDGYFYMSRDDIKRDTGLSKHQQLEVCKKLKNIGLLDYRKKDTDGVNYYKINYEELKTFLCNKDVN